MNNIRTPRHDDVRPRHHDTPVEHRAWEAQQRLERTAAEWAILRASKERLEYMLGVAEAHEARNSAETSVDKKKWEARASERYQRIVNEIAEATQKYFQLDAERAALRLSVELYISLPGDRK